MRMTGSMGTLVLVVTFILPFFVRLVLKLVLILIALLLPYLGLRRVLPAGPRSGTIVPGNGGRMFRLRHPALC